MVKSDGPRFLWKIPFWQNLGKKGPKIAYFAFSENFVILIFFKKMQNGSLILGFPLPTP